MITYRVEIWCSKPKCAEQYRGYPSSDVSNLEALIYETTSDAVHLDGWTTTAAEDEHYCPKHKGAA